MEDKPSSSMLLHCGARKVDRTGLYRVAPPEVLGPRHKPIEHHVLVEELEKALNNEGFNIAREQFALYRGDSLLFGVMDLKHENGNDTALGLRSGNDKSISVQIATGKRVWICDNLCFAYDTIALVRKHTIGLNLKQELAEAVERFSDQSGTLERVIEAAKSYDLWPTQAKALMLDQFVQGAMPQHHLPKVYRNYFEPTPDMEDCQPNTLWGLHNSFTREVRTMKPRAAFETTQELGKLLEIASQ